ncbi:hypothetical protein BC628DRAFT_1285153, partial [Trametes gibbosa]
FVPDLKEHLRQHLQDVYPTLGDQDIPIILHHDRVYQHATTHVNYTSYDLQREQDIIHPSVGKSDVLVHTPSTEEHIQCPWSYARVIGIYHANVITPGTLQAHRVEFLHVRWFEQDTNWSSGSEVRRLEHVRYIPWAPDSTAFGFIDPAHIIRAIHLIPVMS